MLPKEYKKRSFLRFDVGIEVEKLLEDYNNLANDDWSSTYWGNVHCSVGMLLLRGGDSGSESDFYSDRVVDYPVLGKLPYIEYLIGDSGPFGSAKYAFLFKTIPNGITISHEDLREEWFDLYRIHIPIITNEGAFLASNNLSQHYEVGYAWTFDNQAPHGVVNGPSERVHLIMDVPLSDKMKSCIDQSQYFKGREIKDVVNKINNTGRAIQSYPGDKSMTGIIKSLRDNGLDYAQIAAHLNKNKIPTKTYGKDWSSDDVSKLLPAIFI